jgi:hypothetical protein
MSRSVEKPTIPKKRPQWKHKSPYMLLYMPRLRAALAGDQEAYDAADRALTKAFPNSRGRKALRVAKVTRRGG